MPPVDAASSRAAPGPARSSRSHAHSPPASAMPLLSRTLITPNPVRRLSASKSAGSSGSWSGPLPRPARERRRTLRPQRRLRIQVGSERALEVQAADSRFRNRPCSEHPERASRVAVPDEHSADCCGSGKDSRLSTAGPAAEPNTGGRRIGITEFRSGAPVNVDSGQEDGFHVPTVVLEPVPPSAAAHAPEADDPCGDAVLIAGVARVDGQLERPALAVPVILIDRKRLLLAVRDKAQGGLAFRTVGQGECHEGRQESTRRSPPCICRSAVRTTGTTSAGQEDAVAAAARLQTVGTGQPMRHRAGLTRKDPLTSADHAIQQPTCGRAGICPSSVHAPLSPGPDPH